jgi:hypothetical protein
MAATLTPTEDQIFNAVWSLIAQYFATPDQANIFKGFQNWTTQPVGTYAVISPGVMVRQDQASRDYDPTNGLVKIVRHSTYSYQVDCYGPLGADWANTIAIGWRSPWSCDNNAAPAVFTPLYADEPQQLNVINGSLVFEQRFLTKLYLQVNQTVSLPQDFFSTPPAGGFVSGIVVADDLPV